MPETFSMPRTTVVMVAALAIVCPLSTCTTLHQPEVSTARQGPALVRQAGGQTPAQLTFVPGESGIRSVGDTEIPWLEAPPPAGKVKARRRFRHFSKADRSGPLPLPIWETLEEPAVLDPSILSRSATVRFGDRLNATSEDTSQLKVDRIALRQRGNRNFSRSTVRPGESVIVSVRFWNLHHVRTTEGYRWNARTRLEFRSADGKYVRRQNLGVSHGDTAFPRQYTQRSLQFSIPRDLPPGPFTLHVSVDDLLTSASATAGVALRASESVASRSRSTAR